MLKYVRYVAPAIVAVVILLSVSSVLSGRAQLKAKEALAKACLDQGKDLYWNVESLGFTTTVDVRCEEN